MNQSMKKYLVIIVAIFLLSGCVGYDRTLFLTKTNVGLDVSQAPLPTAEITIARREIAIVPTYQDTRATGKDDYEKVEKTLPLLGAFALTGGVINPDISSVFSGGSAAVALAGQQNIPSSDVDSITLRKFPDSRSPIKKLWDWIVRTTPEEARIKQLQENVKPFYFATDTSFGAKVAWDGTGGPYPTSLKIGYNRTEFSYAPILISNVSGDIAEACKNSNPSTDHCRWEVKVPSFFASLVNSSNYGAGLTNSDTGTSQIQVFATGKAATAWAARKSIQQTTFKLMAPDAAKIEKEEK